MAKQKMELEFDKEIDAILRRARGGGAVPVTTMASPHIDADAVAAFAENALPPKAKMLYIEHFADCDRCRRMLSQSMLLNSEAGAATASSVSTPVAEPIIPWYQTLFKTQNLALAMGSFVLILGGMLGFLVLQNRNAETNSSVSQVTEPQPPGGPYFNDDSSNASANAATAQANSAASAAPAANAMANTSAITKDPSANKSGVATGRLDSALTAGVSPDDCKDCGSPTGVAEKPKENPRPVAAPPPPPITMGAIVSDRDERKALDDKLKTESKDLELAKKRTEAEDRGRTRDDPAAPSKSGPMRSGPRQNQSNQVNNNIFDMSVTRSVGGKSFNNRNGVWYDAAYKNQATNNYRRGTSEYKSLDGGIRKIADTLGGTVVLVWKDKAYRVQ